LGLRQDFRREKVYTIDSASTVEIDDGLSLEVISNEDGSTRQRFWYACSQRDHDDVIKLLQY
jgi:exoribonuclease R